MVVQIALSNLDTVLLEARGVLESIGPHLLAEMEDIQKAQFDPACSAPPGPLISDAESALLGRRPTAAGPGQQAVLSVSALLLQCTSTSHVLCPNQAALSTPAA